MPDGPAEESADDRVRPAPAADRLSPTAVGTAKGVTGSAPQKAEAPTETMGRVFSLDEALRLCPDRTERSVCYSERYERLGDGAQGVVEIMESRLYASGLRVHDCASPGPLCPNSVFQCREGKIWYHFSPKHRKFFLSFFHIDGRNGGLPLPEPRPIPGGHGRWCRGLSEDGIAARLAVLLSEHSGLDAELYRSCMRVGADDGNDDDLLDAAGVPDVARDIALSHWVMMLNAHAHHMPRWSVLARDMVVHQQLENPFARSIMIGEATCRLGREFGLGSPGRALRLGPLAARRVGRPVGATPAQQGRWGRLLEECRAILGAVKSGFLPAAMRSSSRHFLTASLMDADIMVDERRLALVRSELIYRLAMTIQVTRPSRSAQRGSSTFDDGGQEPDLMRRYALLSDFVRLSNGFFGRGSGAVDAEVVSELSECGHRGRPILAEVAQSLLDFECSTLLVVDHFSGSPEEPGGLADLHDRLSSIAGELLEVQPSAR